MKDHAWLGSFLSSSMLGSLLNSSIGIVGSVVALSGCDALAPKGVEGSPTESTPGAAPENLPPGVPFSPKSPKVLEVVNGGKLPAYSGPFAVIRGTVRVAGDPAPNADDVLRDIPADCTRARVVYEKLFREGIGRTAPDALVSVTGYDVFVAPEDAAVRVEAHGCAWQTRTIAMMFGQRLDIVSRDDRNYLPTLAGNQDPASFVALAKGKPVSIYPRSPGRFLLQDGTRTFMNTEVFVVKYPTVTVTGLDGKFTLTRVPPGKLTVTAFLPQLLQKADKTLVVQGGKTYDVDLEIPFSRERHDSLRRGPGPGTATGAAAGAGAGPSPGAATSPSPGATAR